MKSLTKEQIETYVLVIVLYFITIGLLLSYIDMELYEGFFAVEDGFIEWLTVAALASSMILSLKRFFSLKSKPLLFRLCLLGAAGIFFFGIGEEISWGQRILGIESPEFFKEHNTQAETNLHNLILGDVRINKVIFGTGLAILIIFYMLILPPLYSKYERVKKFVSSLAIPLPTQKQVVYYIFLFLAVEACPSARKGEMLEFGGSFIFFLTFFNSYNAHIFKNKDSL